MNAKLRYVRPLMSLDATHLRSIWKGTLYIASVKTGMDEIFPVAFAITLDNENNEGWNYFCEHLKKACPTLVIPHVIPRCDRFGYFTFVSDRDKGLQEALKKEFPNNHQTSCAVHIQRNVQVRYGMPASKCIPYIAYTFSSRQEDVWLTELGTRSQPARNYVENIPPETWRNTSWVHDNSLPPRYGKVNSNISESANNMLESARDFFWLDRVDIILDIMTTRIAKLRKLYKDKTGIMPNTKSIMKKRYDNSAGFLVIQIQETTNEYKVTRTNNTFGERTVSHMLNIQERTCTCGKWQDHECPCIDAVAYFRLEKELSFEDILDQHVSNFYKFERQQNLFTENMNPVIVDNLKKDGITLHYTPPPP